MSLLRWLKAKWQMFGQYPIDLVEDLDCEGARDERLGHRFDGPND